MIEEEFEVVIVDVEDGSIVLNDTVTSLQNGFIDLWLPRDRTYQITIENNEKSVESKISTYEGDDTCITTMQLS